MSKWKIPESIPIDWQMREVSSATITVREGHPVNCNPCSISLRVVPVDSVAMITQSSRAMTVSWFIYSSCAAQPTAWHIQRNCELLSPSR
jgi:hypothetical protein